MEPFKTKYFYVLSILLVVILLTPRVRCSISEYSYHNDESNRAEIEDKLLYSDCQGFTTRNSHKTFSLSDLWNAESIGNYSSSFTILAYPEKSNSDLHLFFMPTNPWWSDAGPTQHGDYSFEIPYSIIISNTGAIIKRYNMELKRINRTDSALRRRLTALNITTETSTGLISLQIIGEQEPFISYIDPYPIKVTFVTFYSVEPFIIKFNCPKIESNHTELPYSVEQTDNCLKYTTGPGYGYSESFPISSINRFLHATETVNIKFYLKAMGITAMHLASDPSPSSAYPYYYFGFTKENSSGGYFGRNGNGLVSFDSYPVEGDKNMIEVVLRQTDDGTIIVDINQKRVLIWTDQFPIDIKYASFTSRNYELTPSIWYLNCTRRPDDD